VSHGRQHWFWSKTSKSHQHWLNHPQQPSVKPQGSQRIWYASIRFPFFARQISILLTVGTLLWAGKRYVSPTLYYWCRTQTSRRMLHE
jgi:hypothetical protein